MKGSDDRHNVIKIGTASINCKLGYHGICTGKAGRRKIKCLCLCHGDNSDPLKEMRKKK